MGQEISLEIRWTAEELYIIDGLTYEQVSKKTGVSVSQLQRWGTESDWPARKREHRQASSDIRRKSLLLQKKLIDSAFDSMDPQMVYAAVRLGTANAKMNAAGTTDDPGAAIDKPKQFLENIEFIAGALKEADPEGLKVLAKNFDLLISRFKEAHAASA